MEERSREEQEELERLARVYRYILSLPVKRDRRAAAAKVGILPEQADSTLEGEDLGTRRGDDGTQ